MEIAAGSPKLSQQSSLVSFAFCAATDMSSVTEPGPLVAVVSLLARAVLTSRLEEGKRQDLLLEQRKVSWYDYQHCQRPTSHQIWFSIVD